MNEENEIPIRLETRDGQTVFVCETLDEFWAAWKAMTEGFCLCRGNDKIWVPPRDVLVDKDGQFIFQKRTSDEDEKVNGKS